MACLKFNREQPVGFFRCRAVEPLGNALWIAGPYAIMGLMHVFWLVNVVSGQERGDGGRLP
ncbi:hypothetical protein [Thiocystis violascens]|uniref:Uncharacterized protein n=1 Tax=Thiocystis violascens (strain ATCC 17096 / DSM 198 / 6111) TaxID=765911 RepID=I3Y5K5_THIV6|nr:hypothetical protein [Thiocystis violascens]AFL72273.1 hypothetical protein Thivi_0203 [Thiocystis violascens DSM 198]